MTADVGARRPRADQPLVTQPSDHGVVRTNQPHELPSRATARSTDELGLSMRAINALKNAGYLTMGDLVGVSFESLLEIRSLGPVTARHIQRRLGRALEAVGSERQETRQLVARPGPDDSTIEVVGESLDAAETSDVTEHAELSLWAQLVVGRAKLSPRDAEIFESRLAFDGNIEKLEILGRRFGISRERVRQCEMRAFKSVRGAGDWSSSLPVHLASRLAGRREPLFLDLLSVEDEWFAGFEDRLPFLAQVIIEFTSKSYKAWNLRGRYVVARVDEAGWVKLLKDASEALTASLGAELSSDDVNLILESMARQAGAPELAAELQNAVEQRARFASSPTDDSNVLVGVGTSLKNIAFGILRGAPGPLALAEIQRRILDQEGRSVTANSLRGALRSVGAQLFRRGIYGLRQHYPYAEDECRRIVAQVERIVSGSAATRQWHCDQLIREVRAERGDVPSGFDAYMLNIALERYSGLRYLRRMVWGAPSGGAEAARERREIADLCVAALRRAGGPLSKSELRQEIEKVRGLNAMFLPQPNNFIARMGRGKWGLIDRDFGLTRRDLERATAALQVALTRQTSGLSAQEAREIIAHAGVDLPNLLSDYMLIGLIQADPRFQLGRTGRVRLANRK